MRPWRRLGWLAAMGWALAAWAQEHGAPPAEAGGLASLLQSLGIDPKLLAVQVVGFLVLLALLGRFLYAPLTNLLQERSERIRRDLEEAERHRQEMEKLRAEYEKHLANIEQEARDRLQEAMRQAYAAREQLLAAARAEAEEMRARALEEIRLERDKLRVELRDEMVDLAVRIAERIIERSLDAEAHRRLLDDLLERTLKSDGS